MEFIRKKIAPPGFEPGSQDPESRMIGRYTTGLFPSLNIGARLKGDTLSRSNLKRFGPWYTTGLLLPIYILI